MCSWMRAEVRCAYHHVVWKTGAVRCVVQENTYFVNTAGAAGLVKLASRFCNGEAILKMMMISMIARKILRTATATCTYVAIRST